MEERINVAEILKDCPFGMELNCLMYDDVYFDYVDEFDMIHCYIQWETHKTSLTFNQYGTPNSVIKSKCVIFPKGKTTWEGFQGYFKDGDIVASNDGTWIGITTGGANQEFIPTYCVIKGDGEFEAYFDTKEEWVFSRLATEEEKEKLFKVINDNGYEWDTETKRLEKLVVPKFKDEDRIKKDNDVSKSYIVSSVSPECYDYHGLKLLNNSKDLDVLFVSEEDDCESATNKFDITTLKPFESKVLVRDVNGDNWIGAFYSHYKSELFYVIGNVYYYQCIPYEGNEHLLGTNNDCDEFYKNW